MSCSCDTSSLSSILLPIGQDDYIGKIGSPVDVPCLNNCVGVCHYVQYIAGFTGQGQAIWSFKFSDAYGAPSTCAESTTTTTTTEQPTGVTTTNNPNSNGEVTYHFCYCPLSFCELAALELGDSFSGGVYGGGSIAGENDTDAGWTRSGNTWTSSFTMPCGMSGTMTMECDDASSSFKFSATSDCCPAYTISPPSSSTVQKPPDFTASAPNSSCNCPPSCCHEGDCGWHSGGTTTPSPTTQNPNNGTTTQDPNNGTTTQNPNNGTTTQNPNNGTTTQDPNAPTTCPPGRFGYTPIGGQPCFSCSTDPYCFTGSEPVYVSCMDCYMAVNSLNQGRTYGNQTCETIFDPLVMCN